MTSMASEARDAHSATIHRLGNNRMAAIGRSDDHIIGLSHANLKLVNFKSVNVLPIGLDHRHWHARNTEIEDGHGAAIDHPQAHTLTRIEQHLQPVVRPVPGATRREAAATQCRRNCATAIP